MTSKTDTSQMHLRQLDTPTLVVDLDIVEQNLQRTAEMARAHGIALRPHAKTHKSPFFAHRQLAHGAPGVTVASLGEAEVMVNGGITDILLAYPPVGDAKLNRLAWLMQRANIKVSLDGLEAALPLSRLCQQLGKSVEVYIDVDTGLGRLGLPSGRPSAELGTAIHKLPGLEVVGVMSHCGHIGFGPGEQIAEAAKADAQALVDTANLLRQAGVPVRHVSPGSTVAAPHSVQVAGVTEIRPGTYIFNDINSVVNGVASLEDCAVTIVSTIVSRPQPDRAVIDAGSKSLSSDRCPRREGFGLIKGRRESIIRSVSEEHGVIRLAPHDQDLKVGDVVEIIPNHVCVTVNLTDAYTSVQQGRIVGSIPVAARGRVR